MSDPETVHDLESEPAPAKKSTKPKPMGFGFHFARYLGMFAAFSCLAALFLGLPAFLWWRSHVATTDEKRCVETLHGAYLPGDDGLLRQASYCVRPDSVLEVNR